eukprot:4162404-Prymnesium_polylepis.1
MSDALTPHDDNVLTCSAESSLVREASGCSKYANLHLPSGVQFHLPSGVHALWRDAWNEYENMAPTQPLISSDDSKT